MEARSLRTALGLSWGAAGLAALASAAGLLAPGLYRDNALVRAAWAANDAVTLALALGALLAHRAGVPGALAQLPVWALFTLASSTAAALLLARVRQPAALPAPPAAPPRATP